jgi:hypothetical protein
MVTEQEIREILNREDIEGFLALGAPSDEYEREVELICRAVRASTCTWSPSPVPTEAVKEIVSRIWSARFGPFSDEDLAKRESALERVATKISGLQAPK